MPLALDVLLPLPLAPLRWLAPFGRPAGPVGGWVVVPWRGGARAGLVTGSEEVSAARALELKEAIDTLDDVTAMPSATVAWLAAEAERTVCPPGVVLAGLSPPALRDELDHRVRELDPAGGAAGPWRAATAVAAERLELLRGQGLLEERVTFAAPRRRVLVPAGDAAAPELAGPRREPQRRALSRLAADGEADSGAALARSAEVSESSVRALVRKGLARYEERAAPPADPPLPPSPVPWPDGLDVPAGTSPDAGPAATWIAGGDGALRVARLLPRLRRDLAEGRSPLLLAPERIVAEQAAGWLANEVPVRLARGDEPPRVRRAWERALAGVPAVVVGTWPALASPLPAPARLVVLEAGSESHKLRSGSRSWAPEAARGWAAAHGVPLAMSDVLAGPEIRAIVRAAGGAESGEGEDLPRPRVRWVLSDLGRTRSWPLADELVRVLRQVEARERQALLLVPRRGFSAALGCRDCGAAVMCPNCDLALRWHARDRRLRCHQCGHQAPPPDACPACGGFDLEAQRAAGSEWVLRSLAQALPGLPRYRWDADVRDDVAPLLAGASGVVVGTTAVLRLPRLPVLSLLAVTQIDGGLHADDFRAEERAMRLLASLEEAADGRNPLGLIQTFAPEHPVLTAFVSGRRDRLEGALARMDERRRRFGYPPYGRMARIQASARRADAAWRAAEEVAARLRAAGAGDGELLGPAAAPVARVRGRAMVHLLLLSRDEARRRELLRAAVGPSVGGATVRVDVDPRDIGEVLE